MVLVGAIKKIGLQLEQKYIARKVGRFRRFSKKYGENHSNRP